MRNERNFGYVELLHLFFIIADFDDALDALAQDVDGMHFPVTAVRGRHLITLRRQTLAERCVGVGFVLEAAHQPAAAPGNLGRVEGQVLFLGHLDGYRCELRQVRVAAKRPPAYAHSAENFRLIANADLPQLDARAENARKLLHKIPKINAAVRREVEEDLAVVKCILRLNQFHLQAALCDFCLANLICFFLLDPVFGFTLGIELRGDANDILERLRNLFILKLHRRENDGAVFNAADGLDDDMVIVMDVEIFGVKVVYFTGISEFYSDNCLHFISLIT